MLWVPLVTYSQSATLSLRDAQSRDAAMDATVVLCAALGSAATVLSVAITAYGRDRMHARSLAFWKGVLPEATSFEEATEGLARLMPTAAVEPLARPLQLPKRAGRPRLMALPDADRPTTA